MRKKKFWQNEKGDANTLVGAAVAVLAIIILLMITVFVGSELEDSLGADQVDDTFSITNESFTPINDTYVQLAHTRIVNASETVVNTSTHQVFTSGTDYLMNDTEGKIDCLSTGAANDSHPGALAISYNYLSRSSWGNVTDDTGDLGESSAGILKVGVILMIIFAACGFLIMPYIGDVLGGRRRKD